MPITPPPTGGMTEAELAELAGRAEQGDPEARATLTQLGQVVDDLSGRGLRKYESVDVNASAPPSNMTFPLATSIAPPPPTTLPAATDYTSSVFPGQGAPAPSGGGAVSPPPTQGGDEGPRGGIGGWFDKNKGDLLKYGVGVGLSGLAQAIGGGRSGARAMRGFNEGFLPQMKQQQQVELARRQQAWEDTYQASRDLPPEIYEAEEFGPLTQAAQALQKDMEDGQIDNEKNVSNFLTMQAKYKGEVAEYMRGVELNRKAEELRNTAETQAAITQDLISRAAQELEAAKLTGDPARVQAAQMKLDTIARDAQQLEIQRQRAQAEADRWNYQREASQREEQRSERRLEQGDRSLELQGRRLTETAGREETRHRASAVAANLASQVDSAVRQFRDQVAGGGAQPGGRSEDQITLEVLMGSEANLRQLGEAVGAQLLDQERAIVWHGQRYDLNDPATRADVVRQMYAELQANARFGAQ